MAAHARCRRRRFPNSPSDDVHADDHGECPPNRLRDLRRFSVTMRIAVVTGASGYLGSQICRTLDARGWYVVSCGRSSPPGVADHRRYDLDSPISGELTEVLR